MQILLLQTVIKRGQTVHMLQLFGVYIPLARLYIYIYIYKQPRLGGSPATQDHEEEIICH